MLTHPTHDRLVALGLTGMAKTLDDSPHWPSKSGVLIDCEAAERENKRLVTRLRFASLSQNAVVEDIDMTPPRGLDKAPFQRLAAGEWIGRHQNLLVVGPTGVGKRWITRALGHKACRDNPRYSISACRGSSMRSPSRVAPAVQDAIRRNVWALRPCKDLWSILTIGRLVACGEWAAVGAGKRLTPRRSTISS